MTLRILWGLRLKTPWIYGLPLGTHRWISQPFPAMDWPPALLGRRFRLASDRWLLQSALGVDWRLGGQRLACSDSLRLAS